MPATVFFCEEAGITRRKLRRYVSGAEEKCGAGAYGYHNASALLDEGPTRPDEVSGDLWPHDDPRWPKSCQACGRPFAETDAFQLFHVTLYRRGDTGEIAAWDDMPIGAVRNLPWLAKHDSYRGPDGRVLECVIPAPERPSGKTTWIIDSKASNCARPDDWRHRCWVRHGRPEDGSLHVDKNGDTCAAGAGSIVSPGWHGFLHHGALTP